MEPPPLVLRRDSYSESERHAIRQQLERMLAGPPFKNSKRYPILLRYVVEHTLEGHTADLKERTLGVEVFGRDADYDTNADPVVRATAGEIRKRIAMYYHEHGRESEVRIELNPGSYIPEFGIPVQALPVAPQAVPVPVPTTAPARFRAPRWQWMAGMAVFGALLIVAAWYRPWALPNSIDRFWRPVLDSSNTVLLCVGQREFLGSAPEAGQSASADIPMGSNGPITLFQLYYLGSQNVELSDVRTIGRMAGLLQAKGKSFHIRGQSSTNFGDLRDGSVVLVGAFNNDWTMRLMGPMRFSFERDGDTFWIRDRQKPSQKEHAINYRTPYLDVTEDYALISRVLDPTTERMVVVAGGLTGYGTLAAGEFLTDPRYLDAIAKTLPPHWERKNIQLLLTTKVIHGNSGPPRVLDRYFW
jgi:hypothetical protein